MWEAFKCGRVESRHFLALACGIDQAKSPAGAPALPSKSVEVESRLGDRSGEKGEVRIGGPDGSCSQHPSLRGFHTMAEENRIAGSVLP